MEGSKKPEQHNIAKHALKTSLLLSTTMLLMTLLCNDRIGETYCRHNRVEVGDNEYRTMCEMRG
jgi:hypothetical protein